jgi:hypothetical protein
MRPRSTPSHGGHDPTGETTVIPAAGTPRVPAGAPKGRPAVASKTVAASKPVAVRFTPARRLLSLVVGGFAGMLMIGLIFGAQTTGVGSARFPYAVVIFGIQVLFVLAFTIALRPPGTWVVAGAGLGTAIAADLASVVPQQAVIRPLLYLAVIGCLVGVFGQLLRRSGRIRLTESFAATVVVVAGVTAYATLVVLTRIPIGTQAITICLTAAGLGLVVARLADTVVPWPRISPQVPRGALGVVLGPMLGTAAASSLGSYLVGFSPTSGGMVGLVAAVAAVLADVSVGYADAGRRLAGERPTMWIARHLQGPLAGFAVAAPLAYVLSAVFFIDRFPT